LRGRQGADRERNDKLGAELLDRQARDASERGAIAASATGMNRPSIWAAPLDHMQVTTGISEGRWDYGTPGKRRAMAAGGRRRLVRRFTSQPSCPPFARPSVRYDRNALWVRSGARSIELHQTTRSI